MLCSLPCSALLALSVLVTATDADEPIRLIAHRGGVVNDQIIENNLAAIDEAARRGYWMVESDVRRTRDGIPIVHHDRTFQRYYGEPRPVSEMDWDEIARLRSTPGGERPQRFSEFAAACQGRLQIMLDVKGDDLPRDYFQSIENSLAEHDLLDTAYLIGTDQSKEYFRDKIRIGANAGTLFTAAQAGEPVAQRYFLFDRGSRITKPMVRRAKELGVPVVAGINRFRYPDDETTARNLAEADVSRLRTLGVTQFQIDSQYDVWFPK